MNKERAKQLGLSTLLNGESLLTLRDLLNQSYDSTSGRGRQIGSQIAIQVGDDQKYILEVALPGSQVKYVVTGTAPQNAAPGRYVSRKTEALRRNINRSTTMGVYYGISQIELHSENYRISAQVSNQATPLRVAVKDAHPDLNECLSIELSLKTLRKIINKVSRENRGLFCLASSDNTWNVFSESANDDSNRFRLAPEINSNGVAGVFYNRLYDVLFRKKEALRGVFRDHDENTLITLGVNESSALMIKLGDRGDSSRLYEYLLFESDPEAPTTSELPEALPFKGVRVTPLMATESTLEKPIEVAEEIQAEEPKGVETEVLTLSEEETARLAEWGVAYNRWAETTGLKSSELSTSPTVWFSRYMMEKLRLGEVIDELDNQLLSKY